MVYPIAVMTLNLKMIHLKLVHSEPSVNRPSTSDCLMSRLQTIMNEIDLHVKNNDINPDSFENGIINLEKNRLLH